MIPAYARPAHRRLRQKLAEIAGLERDVRRSTASSTATASLGIITSGIALMHAREAAPEARVLKLGMTYPLPLRDASATSPRASSAAWSIEEGDPYLVEALRAAGIAVEGKPEMYRFGELNVARVRRILAGDTSPEPAPPPGKPPQLCHGCPHRDVFEMLREARLHRGRRHRLLHAGRAAAVRGHGHAASAWARASAWASGCGTCCRRSEARRVVSVIGDSTFVHSGITGLVEMVYNPPPTGHVRADPGQRHHGHDRPAGASRHRPHARPRARPARSCFEDLARALGIEHVHVIDPHDGPGGVRARCCATAWPATS